jgi:hypothetical protein
MKRLPKYPWFQKNNQAAAEIYLSIEEVFYEDIN